MSGGKGTGLRLPSSRIGRPNQPGGTTKSNCQSSDPPPPGDFIIGDKVWVSGTKPGTILFIGETQFADGEWAGVLLDDSSGKNDGTVQGIRYFQCPPNRGLFARLTNLRREPKPLKSSAAPGTNGDSSDGAPSELSSIVSPHASTHDEEEPPEEPTAQRQTGLVLPKQISVGPHGDAGPHHSSNNNNGASPASTSLGVPSAGDLRVGDRVVVVSGNRAGTLRYLGTTEFAKGSWAGVELDDPTGKNDGSVAGKRYFACKPTYGLFAPIHKVVKAGAAGRVAGRRSAMPPGPGKMSSGMRSRSGSQESISSVGSNFSSASRTRVKLGITALSSNQMADRQKDSQMRRSNNNAGSGTTAPSSAQRRSSTTGTATTPTSGKAVSVTALQKVLREKEEHIEQLMKERDMERSEVVRVAAQADEIDARRVMLEQERSRILSDADGRLVQLEKRLAESEAARQQLQIKFDDEKRRVEELQFEMEEENIDKTTLETKTEEDESKIFELEEALANEKEKSCQLEEKTKQLKELYEAEKTKSREAEESAVMYLEQIEALQSSRDRSQSDEIRAQLEAKEAALREIQDRAEKADRQVKQLERSLEAETEEKATLLKRRQQHDTQIANLTARVDKVKKEKAAAVEEAREAVVKLGKMETELQVTRERSDTLSSSVKDLQNQLATASEAKAGDDNDAKAEMKRLTEQVAENQRALATAQDALSRSEARCRQLEAELKEVGTQHSKKTKEAENSHQAQLRSIQEKLEEVTADRAAAESRCARMQASHSDDLEAERKAAAANLESLSKQLAERESAMTATHASADQMRDQLEDVRREKSRLELSLKTAEADRAEQIQAKRAAVEEREKLAANILSAEEEMSQARRKVEDLGKERDAAIEEKNKAMMTATEMKAKAVEIQMRVDCLSKEKNDLESRLAQAKTELDAKSANAEAAARDRIANLEKEVIQTQESSNELRLYNSKLESERNGLVTEINKLKSIMDEKTRLQRERDELQGQLKEMRHKRDSFRTEIAPGAVTSVQQDIISHLESMNSKTQEQLSEMGNELRTSRDQLISLTRENETLRTKHRQGLETKEKDRRRLEEKIRGLEQKLKEESKKLAARPKTTGNSRDESTRRLQDAKENAEQQIEFLNSVIVEMQGKNQELTRRVQILSDSDFVQDNGNGVDGSVRKPSLPPRLYCDICELFDKHDTEDCNRQMSSSFNSQFHGPRDASRPYCDTCEMFDHWTHECDDQVTF